MHSGSGVTMVGSSEQHKTRDSLSICLRYRGMQSGSEITMVGSSEQHKTRFSFYLPEVPRYAQWLRDYLWLVVLSRNKDMILFLSA